MHDDGEIVGKITAVIDMFKAVVLEKSSPLPVNLYNEVMRLSATQGFTYVTYLWAALEALLLSVDNDTVEVPPFRFTSQVGSEMEMKSLSNETPYVDIVCAKDIFTKVRRSQQP